MRNDSRKYDNVLSPNSMFHFDTLTGPDLFLGFLLRRESCLRFLVGDQSSFYTRNRSQYPENPSLPEPESVLNHACGGEIRS